MSVTIQQDVSQTWHDAIVELFELDLEPITGSASDKYYFTAGVMPDNSKMQWKGETYEPLPIEASGFERTTQGQIPTPELTVANVLGTLASVVNALDDLVGAKVVRRRTLLKYLDNGTEPDSSQEFPEDIFYIERKIAETSVTITWQLASKIDLEGLLLPRRVITQNHCLWRYRGPECGYSGPPVANEFDLPPTGGSTAYIDALNALLAANAALASAEAELNAARNQQDIVCDIDIIERSEPRFNLRRSASTPPGVYTFGILDGATYFAAYDENVLVPASNFDYGFDQQEAGDGIFGEPQNTGRGSTGNGTGPVYAINRWLAVYEQSEDPNAPPPTVPVDFILAETRYDPPRYFAFFDLENSPIIAVDGTIRGAEGATVQLNTPPGQKPSISSWPPGQIQAWAVGDKEENNVAPVVEIQVWEVASGQCDSATERVEAAEAALEAAEAAQAAAQAAFDAALAALPPDDPVFSNDRCGKRLTSCRLRFGSSTLPFGAFPGANLYR